MESVSNEKPQFEVIAESHNTKERKIIASFDSKEEAVKYVKNLVYEQDRWMNWNTPFPVYIIVDSNTKQEYVIKESTAEHYNR